MGLAILIYKYELRVEFYDSMDRILRARTSNDFFKEPYSSVIMAQYGLLSTKLIGAKFAYWY